MNNACALLLLAAEASVSGDKQTANTLFYEAVSSDEGQQLLDELRHRVGLRKHQSMSVALAASEDEDDVNEIDADEAIELAPFDTLVPGKRVIPSSLSSGDNIESVTKSPVSIK